MAWGNIAASIGGQYLKNQVGNAVNSAKNTFNSFGNALSGGTGNASLDSAISNNQQQTTSAPAPQNNVLTGVNSPQTTFTPPPAKTTSNRGTTAKPAAPSAPSMPSVPGFNAQDYAALNPDVVQQLGNDPAKLLNHYLNFGIKEGRFYNLQDAAIAGKTPGTQNTTFEQEQANAKAYFDALENQKREAERRAAEERQLAEQELGLANQKLDNSVSDYRSTYDFANKDIENSQKAFYDSLYAQNNRQNTEIEQQKEDLSTQYSKQAEGMDAADEKKRLEILNIFAARGTSQSSEFNKTLAEYQGNTIKLRQDFNTAFNTALSRLDKEKQLLSNEYSNKITSFDREAQTQKAKLVADYERAIKDFGLARAGLSLEQMKQKADIQKRASDIFNQIEQTKGQMTLALQQRVADQNKQAEAIRLDLAQRRTQFNEQIRQYENNFAFQKQQARSSGSGVASAQGTQQALTAAQEKDAYFGQATQEAQNFFKSNAFNPNDGSTEKALIPALQAKYGGILGTGAINDIAYTQRKSVSGN